MITKISIERFKSHRQTILNELSYLNVLTGANGVGKSSIIQALLLLRQTFKKGRLKRGLDLHGDFCSLGSANDVLHFGADKDEIIFCFEHDEKPFAWFFSAKKLRNTSLEVIQYPETNLELISLFNNNFQYLSASRLSAEESYPKDTFAVEDEQQLSIKNGRGELVAHFLSFYGIPSTENSHFQIELPLLLHKDEPQKALLLQTSAWMKEISADINVKVYENDKNFEIKYSFNRYQDTATDDINPTNVGFGISYTLSVVVAILSAKKDALIIIENPEAHIHPKGQSKLAELLALAAQSGIQIIIETHSDHIINGILVAIKKMETEGNGISHDKVKMYFVERTAEGHSCECKQLTVSQGGFIQSPPAGFFDQIGIDQRYLLGLPPKNTKKRD